jgi:hypothetical protein
MPRTLAILALAAATAVSAPLAAKERGGRAGAVPIEHDLRNLAESDRRLGIDRDAPGFEPNVRPWNPAGVVGYSGPPWGTYGDSVGNTGPLPPGNPLNEY